jgi:CheY-like chemotaxis protein
MENHLATILIVDDEEMERVLARAILEKAGHDLLFATDGGAALRLCRTENVELVVTDLAMPDFNGLRFIKELRKAGIRIPVIAISGWAPDQLDLAEDYGADVKLFKPTDGPELVEAVEEMLNLSDLPDRKDPWRKGRYR